MLITESDLTTNTRIKSLQFFRDFMEHKAHTKSVMWWSLGIFVVSFGLGGLLFSMLGPNPAFDNWTAMLALTAMDINNIGMTGIILAGFVMIYQRAGGRKWLASFAPYGRTALTNYVIQSIIGTFIFYGWGMGYLAELRNIYTFLMAFAIIGLQMIISKWWLNKFYYGPFEWIWRSLTHMKLYPLMRGEEQLQKA